MKYFLLSTFCFILHLNSSAHEFYFAYAEIEINEMNNRLEATFVVTTHDLEKVLRDNYAYDVKISGNENNLALIDSIRKVINKGFSLNGKVFQSNLKIDGIEVQLNGITNIFCSQEVLKIDSDMNVKFDLMMDTFESQQNKITLMYRGKKSSLVFIPTMKSQIIKLDE